MELMPIHPAGHVAVVMTIRGLGNRYLSEFYLHDII